VSAPLPYFVETFLDNGYMDMYKIMKTLVEVDFDGVMIPDHIPVIANDPRTSLAYTVGYMKALLERANAEVAEMSRQS
jgi:mannonate dehydratase